MKWQTPVYHVNLASFQPQVSELNGRLAEKIIHHFDALAAANEGKYSLNGWEANGINQVGVRGDILRTAPCRGKAVATRCF